MAARRAYAVVVVLLVCLAVFYRHPAQNPLARLDERGIYSPCYGTVEAVHSEAGVHHVAVFLSPFDVHVQYYPCNGTYAGSVYDATGKYALAYELSKSSENEKNTTYIVPDADPATQVTVVQIAGRVVRRITAVEHRAGERVSTGEKLGMIAFGSRVDITLPGSFVLHVMPGDVVRGSWTKIATAPGA
jgi:phosphatidylserine decarboxylase